MAAGIPFGEYRLIRRLGAGGMAEVFLAKRVGPQGFEKQLVIKRILPHLSQSPRFTQMFLDEARLAARIDHPNLVHVSGFGEIDGSYYLAMEFVDGITVADLLKLVHSVSPGVAGRIAIDLLAALHAIHTARGPDGAPMRLVHRDVSARNVMLSRDGSVKLLDFGIAVQADQAPAAAMGTKRYMSPEQQRSEPLDARADLYSVGVLLWELITGGPPPPARPLSRPEVVPAELWPCLTSALADLAEGRPASAQRLQTDLELFVGGRGVEGTRAHLAELCASLIGKPNPIERALTRLTRITQIRSGSHSKSATAPAAPRLLPLGLLAFAAAALVTVAVLRPEPSSSSPPVPGEPGPASAVVAPPAPAPAPAPAPVKSEPPAKGAQTATRAAPPAEPPRRRHPKEPSGFGRLTIDTQPWSEVYLGGRRLGVTPMEGVRVPSGTHELELRNPDLDRKEKVRVVIRTGKTTRLRRTW